MQSKTIRMRSVNMNMCVWRKKNIWMKTRILIIQKHSSLEFDSTQCINFICKTQVLLQYQTHARQNQIQNQNQKPTIYRFSSRTRNRKDTGSPVEPETGKIQVLLQNQKHTRYRFSSRTRNTRDTGFLVEPDTHKIQVLQQNQNYTRCRFSISTRHTQDTGSLVEPETEKIQVLLQDQKHTRTGSLVEPETHKIQVLWQNQKHKRYRFSCRTIKTEDAGSLIEPET